MDFSTIDGHDIVTGLSSAAAFASAIKFSRQSTLTRSLISRLSRRTIRRTQMDLWIARLETANPGLKLPPFPEDQEKDDDDIKALARASE